MAIGTVFIYLLLAALVAPFVWVIWWVFASAFEPAGAAQTVRPTPQPTKRQGFDYPRPVDITLARRPGAIVIYSLADPTEIGSCRGADAAGKCPRALTDGSVACAGSLLSLPAPIRGSAEWQIPFGYKVCPVASYDVYRRASQAN